MMSEPDTPSEAAPSDLYTASAAQYRYNDDEYRVRNLWVDVCMHAMQRGWASRTAAEAADECVDRYKAKFDVR